VDGDLITSADKLPASYKDACLLAICNASNIVNHSHIVKTRSAHYLQAMLRMKLHLFAKKYSANEINIYAFGVWT